MTKKRLMPNLLILFIISTFMLTLLSYTCLAANNEIIAIAEKEDIFLYDEDNCIADDTEVKLNELLIELEEKTEAEVAVISIPSLNNLTIEEYANELFNTLGIGKKGKDNGVLLLFSKSDNKVRLEIGRGLEGCLNDAKCGRILDNFFVPYREDNNYTEATKLTVSAIISVISEEYAVEIEGAEPIDIPEEDTSIPIWFIVLLVILVILIFIVDLGSDGSSGGSYYGGSSGSFGGSSGGGFGGGFSGGAGASR